MKEQPSKSERKRLLIEMMKEDEKNGMYEKSENSKQLRPIEELWIEEYYGMNPDHVNERIPINTDYGDIVNLLTMFKEKFLREAFHGGYYEGYEDAFHHEMPNADFDEWTKSYNSQQHERK